MRLYIKFFAMHLRSQLQYKTSFFLTLFSTMIVSFSTFFGLYFMFSRFNAVEGFAYEQALLCFAVMSMAFSLAEVLGRGFDLFPRMLGNGEFDRALLRPRSVIFQVLAGKMDFTRAGRLIQAVVILCYAAPKSGVAWTPDKIITMLLMIVCGSLVFFGLFIVYAAFSFFTIEGLEFMNVLTNGGMEFGRYPFSIYGRTVLRFLTFVVPLALVQYYPLLYLLGMETRRVILLPPAALLFLLPGYLFFRFGLRRFKSTGS